jgi:stage III sporulation protein AH
MINKKNLWFLTLFSLILVLSIYYITMPSELLMTTKEKVNNITKQQKEKKKSKSKEIVKEVEEADIISAMRIESDSVMKDEIDKLQLVINNEKSTVDDKNKAYDKIKEINNNRALEEQLEKKLKDELKLDSYIKIEDNKIKVTINSSEHDASSANKIMRNIQSNFDESKYISVKFQK